MRPQQPERIQRKVAPAAAQRTAGGVAIQPGQLRRSIGRLPPREGQHPDAARDERPDHDGLRGDGGAIHQRADVQLVADHDEVVGGLSEQLQDRGQAEDEDQLAVLGGLHAVVAAPQRRGGAERRDGGGERQHAPGEVDDADEVGAGGAGVEGLAGADHVDPLAGVAHALAREELDRREQQRQRHRRDLQGPTLPRLRGAGRCGGAGGQRWGRRTPKSLVPVARTTSTFSPKLISLEKSCSAAQAAAACQSPASGVGRRAGGHTPTRDAMARPAPVIEGCWWW